MMVCRAAGSAGVAGETRGSVAPPAGESGGSVPAPAGRGADGAAGAAAPGAWSGAAAPAAICRLLFRCRLLLSAGQRELLVERDVQGEDIHPRLAEEAQAPA